MRRNYIYAIIMTLGFTYFINFTMRHVLNKVDMVESLKSIEQGVESSTPCFIK